jgi:hypothetical protein
MNLNRKRLVREKQLKQQRRVRVDPGSLVPDFADRAVLIVRITPRSQISYTPKLWNGMRVRMFNGHYYSCLVFEQKTIFRTRDSKQSVCIARKGR